MKIIILSQFCHFFKNNHVISVLQLGNVCFFRPIFYVLFSTYMEFLFYFFRFILQRLSERLLLFFFLSKNNAK